ncbi:MAG: carboxymuconolactone decarboxylase family protein [Oceanococcus sp.]
MNLEDIDPALGSLSAFAKANRSTSGHISAMREEAIFTDGEIPARQKALMAALWSVSARCEPCMKFYVQKAMALGATEAELNEVLSVASVMGGCVGEMWAVKAYHAATNEEAGEACCN